MASYFKRILHGDSVQVSTAVYAESIAARFVYNVQWQPVFSFS
jgi:hypothetical protein